MRHIMRRAIQLIGLALLLPLWPAGDADAVFEAALRGDYNVTLTRSCNGIVTETFTGSGVFTSTGTPPIFIQGTVSYNGSGGGSFTGQILNMSGGGAAGTGISLGIPPGGSTPNETFVNQINLSPCTVTYTVNADGTFTQQFTCTATFLTGSNTGLSNTQNFALAGHMSLDGTVLVISKTSLDQESVTIGFGPFVGQSFNRLCSTSGLATSKR